MHVTHTAEMDTPIALIERDTGNHVERILVFRDDVMDKDTLDLLERLLAHI